MDLIAQFKTYNYVESLHKEAAKQRVLKQTREKKSSSQAVQYTFKHKRDLAWLA